MTQHVGHSQSVLKLLLVLIKNIYFSAEKRTSSICEPLDEVKSSLFFRCDAFFTDSVHCLLQVQLLSSC